MVAVFDLLAAAPRLDPPCTTVGGAAASAAPFAPLLPDLAARSALSCSICILTLLLSSASFSFSCFSFALTLSDLPPPTFAVVAPRPSGLVGLAFSGLVGLVFSGGLDDTAATSAAGVRGGWAERALTRLPPGEMTWMQGVPSTLKCDACFLPWSSSLLSCSAMNPLLPYISLTLSSPHSEASRFSTSSSSKSPTTKTTSGTPAALAALSALAASVRKTTSHAGWS
mmetsp:Transcript_28801/g.67358  ORF Transcript_28801/g.67358 Transcript_28801/m.67358 type:complete len:226 (-) Transcript_28801:74-751(-)